MIAVEQNNERQLQRLAAQRQLYAFAKTLFGWQLFLSGPVAVASAFAVLAFPAFKGVAAGWGVLVTLADICWLTPWQKRLRSEAARIQEAFDCDVLELPWNDLKAGSRPDPEFVKEQSDQYQRWGQKMPTLSNWYAPVVDELPLQIGRIACQRSNCWWDSKQRRRYAAWIIGIVIAVFLIVLSVAFGNGVTIEDFVLKVAAPLAPALLLGIRQFYEQIESASRLDKLKEHAERLWKDALAGRSKTEVTSRSRNLQDEILENRRKSPLVFDGIFKRLRPSYEQQMNFGVAELVAEAKQKLGLN
jgi:hypothetical protein